MDLKTQHTSLLGLTAKIKCKSPARKNKTNKPVEDPDPDPMKNNVEQGKGKSTLEALRKTRHWKMNFY